MRTLIGLLVGGLLSGGCATTGVIHTVGEVGVDPVNGVVFGGNFVRRTVSEIDRRLGPKLYWQNRYGGWQLIDYDGYSVPLVSDQGHVRLQLVCNCNPRSAELLLNGVHERSVYEGSWELPVRNRHTNARTAYTLRLGCEEDPTDKVWERHFYVLSSGPRMDTGRRW